ncbi:MAG: plasmid stabilization protein, partial [Cytophagaceae bacterium]
MKVAVINISGNVGKTTVAGYLLKPRMGAAPLISVESVNLDASADGLEVEKMRGTKYGDLQNQLMELDAAIIDVGASNSEDFLKLMQQYSDSHEEFDYFIVPVVKERKQLADTIST